MSIPESPYAIGTKFIRRGRGYETEIVDHHTTTNSKGEIVKFRYVVEYEYLGQPSRSEDFLHITIKMSLAEQAKPA